MLRIHQCVDGPHVVLAARDGLSNHQTPQYGVIFGRSCRP
jgi:hypothetical protein